MVRRTVEDRGAAYVISDDDALAPELRWWAVLRARVIDEITGKAPGVPLRLRTTTRGCTPRVDSDGNCGLVARASDVVAELTTPGALTAEVSAPGFLARSLTAAIDAARRQLPGGAATGDPRLVVTPPDSTPRTQFTPGRGVALARQSPTTAEEFNLVGLPVVPPLANEVPLAEPARGPQAAATRVAGVPIVLADQPLHRDSTASLRGRVRRQATPGAAPMAAPAAEFGITGVWWTQPEVRANSAPPHAPNIVSTSAPLAFDHPAMTSVEHCTLAPDLTGRRLVTPVARGGSEILVSPWNALNTAGGDVLQVELDNSKERELVVLGAFAPPALPANPARIPLRTPLAFAHAASTPAVLVTVSVTSPLTLEREAQSGDTVLFATSLAGVASSAVLRIAPGAASEELRFVRRVPTFEGGAFAHPPAVQSDGTFRFPAIGRIAQLRLRVAHTGQIPEQIDVALEYGGDNTQEILLKP
jgi:hypothetical protein